MKLKNLLWSALALTTVALTGCSSDEPGPNGGGESFQGDGFMSVRINLPQRTSTRAANDNYDDGLPSEYNVKNGLLVLFQGTAEANATCIGAYTITGFDGENDADNDNITTSYAKTVAVKNMDLGENDHLYVLVMLNFDQVCTFKDNQIYFGETAFTGTIANLQQAETTFGKTMTSDGYIFMTNAPMADKIGDVNGNPEGANLTVLADAEKKVYPTEGQAKNNPACNVFVERAVAKATLDTSKATVNIKTKDEKGNVTTLALTPSFEWVIDNCEPTTYVVRNLGTDYSNLLPLKSDAADALANCCRFVGGVAMGSTNITPYVPLYRTYWCVDPNYDKAMNGAIADANTTFKASNEPLYCNENTFTVQNQSYANTTRALLKVTFKNGENGVDLFMVNGDQTTVYMSEDNTGAKQWVLDNPGLQAAIKATLPSGTTVENIAPAVTLKWKDGTNAATRVLDDIVVDVTKINGDQSKFSWDATALITTTNNNFAITKYAGGVAYYPVRIKHFGDDLTPWTATGSTDSTAAAYGSDNAKYLGRYGMVRNNWYDLAIGSINKIGDAIIPGVSVNKPDDNKDDNSYISVRINILSWAKRVQNVEL